jgi:hypothetical protein
MSTFIPPIVISSFPPSENREVLASLFVHLSQLPFQQLPPERYGTLVSFFTDARLVLEAELSLLAASPPSLVVPPRNEMVKVTASNNFRGLQVGSAQNKDPHHDSVIRVWLFN